MTFERSATGNIIIARLVSLAMLESEFNAEKLSALYSFYGTDLKSMERGIREFVYSCDMKKLSWRTFEVAKIAIDYFEKLEKNGGFNMSTLIESGQKLFIVCPSCGSVMEYSKTVPDASDETKNVFLYECKDCSALLDVKENQVEHYLSIETMSGELFVDALDEVDIDVEPYNGCFDDNPLWDVTEKAEFDYD